LFAAIAERSDPVHLHEVIRHNHEVDREAAKLIREGRSREALSLYQEAERITIKETPELLRGAMVEDWWRSFSQGEDALMVAKRNSEVQRLNAIARELAKSEGRLGAEEIAIGGAPFAAGDQVITRVNDQAVGIFNRERWEVAQVDAERGRMILEGIDQARRVEVGRDYLDRTTLGGDAPAVQHAYAVTTYCAQGATVDRAYVMAEPSTDKQEMYVATSRTREETRLYATPEIQVERNEFAPAAPEREPIAHIAEAAARDRAQTAAHDEALRAKLAKLPSEELAARHRDLSLPAGNERTQEERYATESHRLDEARKQLERAVAKCEAIEALGRRERREQLPDALSREETWGRAVKERTAALERIEPAGTEARRERELAEQLLDQRTAKALAAARIEPPSYIAQELGERPSEPAKARVWDRGVHKVERYRLERGATDRESPFGPEPTGPGERSAYRAAERSLALHQCRLELSRHLETRERGIEMDLGEPGL
jgi:hypothetical protein